MRGFSLRTKVLGVCAALFLSAGPAAAADPNMQTAMDAVFGKTGEKKKLKIGGHEFNVKPAKISTKPDGTVVITGQISHHLTLRDDDQVYYTIEKKSGQVVKLDVRVSESKMQKVLGALKKEVIDALVNKITGGGGGGGGGETKPQPEPKDPAAKLALMTKQLEQVDQLAGKGWGDAVKTILGNIAIRADAQGRDALPLLRAQLKPGVKPKVAPIRKK
jgi:hypothetical protein